MFVSVAEMLLAQFAESLTTSVYEPGASVLMLEVVAPPGVHE
jgi:hypothetical protein